MEKLVRKFEIEKVIGIYNVIGNRYIQGNINNIIII